MSERIDEVVRLYVLLVGVIACLFAFLPNGYIYAEADPDQSITEDEESLIVSCEAGEQLLITEIQTGTSNFRYEFVELHNNSPKLSIDLSGCNLLFEDEDKEMITSVDLYGQLPPGGFIWVVHNSYLNHLNEVDIPEPFVVFADEAGQGDMNALKAGGGYVTIVDENEDAVDKVAYGNIKDEDTAALKPPSGQSIKRCIDEEGFFVKTSNVDDFIITDPPALSYLFSYGPACPEPLPYQAVCEDILITELFANPIGASTGKQFIELYNSASHTISLDGCGLQSTAGTNVFWFGNVWLEPGQYQAFYDSQTDIRLPISPGGTVFLLSGEVEILSVSYPEAMPEGTSWAVFDGHGWKQTFVPTPGTGNILQLLRSCPAGQERNPETNRCRTITDTAQTLASCGPGRERNPETNRYRNIDAPASALVPCGPGRERNPETNRCRNINASASTLVPCGPGRERNPETNRCRNIASASSALKPCGPNQERNPETNRCRNIVAPNEGAIAGVKDVRTVQVANTARWWTALAVFMLAVLYGIWEWRYDLRNYLAKLRSRAPPIVSS